jgi:hypothetical protein
VLTMAGPLRHRTGAAHRSVTLSFCSCVGQLITRWAGPLVSYFRAKKRKGRSFRRSKSESEQKVATTMADLRAGITVLFHAEDAEER